MRILITGGAGFLGARLAREILKRGQLNGQTVKQLVIADLFPAPADLLTDLVAAGVPTLAFVPSRRGTETVVRASRSSTW